MGTSGYDDHDDDDDDGDDDDDDYHYYYHYYYDETDGFLTRYTPLPLLKTLKTTSTKNTQTVLLLPYFHHLPAFWCIFWG